MIKKLLFVFCLLFLWGSSELFCGASASYTRYNYPKIQGKGSGHIGEEQKLFAYDFIRVDVFQETDLLTEVEIGGDGDITLPLIGKLRVSGLTVREAQSLVEKRYKQREILINPQVNIVVLRPAERIIQIQGQVHKPGPVVIPHSRTTMTLSEVISAASDVNLRSNPSKVQIKTTDDEGKRYVYKVNYKKLRSGDIEDVFLKDGDEVYVPESIF